MRTTVFVLAALLAAAPASAQKWVDDKGKVYYGAKPPGIAVKPAEMKGGGSGTYSTEDLSNRLQKQADAKSAAQSGKGPRHVGKAAEYRPDMPRGGPPNREILR